MLCGKCSTENPEGITHCTNCGSDLASQTPFEKRQASDTLDGLPTVLQPEIEAGSFKTGSLFANRYEILSDGRKGGMGIVYKVKDTKLNKLSALKIIHPKLIDSSEAISRFRQEVSISRDLLHSNIVRVYDLQEWEGKEFFTMEFLDGCNLAEYIKKNRGKLEFLSACDIVSQICNALDYAHHRKVIHRDIKPHNIFILPDGSVKLLDFGLAKLIPLGEVRAQSMLGGTMHYVSPEQSKGKGADERSDIYALGVVFYKMLTGEEPMGRFKLPSEMDEEIPDEVDAISEKCLNAEPEGRYGDAKDLSEALSKVVAVESKRIEEEAEKAEEAKRLEVERQKQEEERRQREEREKEQRGREKSKRKEKEARDEQIRERKRKKQENGNGKKNKLTLIVLAGVFAVIGIFVVIIFGTGSGNKIKDNAVEDIFHMQKEIKEYVTKMKDIDSLISVIMDEIEQLRNATEDIVHMQDDTRVLAAEVGAAKSRITVIVDEIEKLRNATEDIVYMQKEIQELETEVDVANSRIVEINYKIRTLSRAIEDIFHMQKEIQELVLLMNEIVTDVKNIEDRGETDRKKGEFLRSKLEDAEYTHNMTAEIFHMQKEVQEHVTKTKYIDSRIVVIMDEIMRLRNTTKDIFHMQKEIQELLFVMSEIVTDVNNIEADVAEINNEIAKAKVVSSSDKEEGSENQKEMVFVPGNRTEWSEWQEDMTFAYDEALRGDSDARLRIREKARNWKRLIGDFRQDNPHSSEDNRIRRHAKMRLKEYMRLAGRPDKPGRPGRPGRPGLHPGPPKERRR